MFQCYSGKVKFEYYYCFMVFERFLTGWATTSVPKPTLTSLQHMPLSSKHPLAALSLHMALERWRLLSRHPLPTFFLPKL